MNIHLRLYRCDGLHGEISMGDVCAELDDVGTFILSDAVDRIMERMGDRPAVAIKLNGRIISLKEAEKAIITHAVTFDKSLKEIASELEIDERTLYNRRKEYGLPMRDW